MCADFKANLVDSEENEEDRPSLSEVAAESVATLRILIRRARRDLKEGEGGNAKSFARGADMAMKAGNAAAKVLEAARKLQQDGVAVIKSMSFVERLELFAGWFVSLPPPYRAKLMAHLTHLEAQSAKQLPERTSND